MTMPKGRPITLYDRERIEVWIRMKKKKTWMAKKLGRDYSIIKREIKRNTGDYLPYNALTAHTISKRRAKKTNVRKLEKEQNKNLKELIEEKIYEDLSPQQIIGELEGTPPVWQCETVSHETIYQYIYNHAEKYKQLYRHLRTGRKKRQRRYYRKKRGNIIKNRVSIHERPPVIAQKKDYGHWETDLMEFTKGAPVLCVNYEKKSQLNRIFRSKNKSAVLNEEHITEVIDEFPPQWCKSFTRDNGSENAYHLKTYRDYDIPSYFCDPQCSWQKGGVENLNKLIRQYLPRNCDFENISDTEIYAIQERLNNRPRKGNNYLTPNTIFALETKKGL